MSRDKLPMGFFGRGSTLSLLLGCLISPLPVSVIPCRPSLWNICFSRVHLLRLCYPGFSPSCPAVLPSFRLCCVDMYCLALTVTNFVSSLVGLCICSMCASISCGRPVTIIVSETSFPVLVPCVLRCVLGFVFTFPCSSSVSGHLAVVVILCASGVLGEL